MAPKLYMISGSPPCRAVFATAKALDISLDLQMVDLAKGEHLTPEYLKINPQHTVPTLVDDGKTISDSHAISIYLVDKYGKNDTLYPKHLHKRALVNERLFFNIGNLFSNMRLIWFQFITKEVTTVPAKNAKTAEDGYVILEKLLQGHQWAAGDNATLADIVLYTTVSAMDVLVPVNSQTYPNITAWLKLVKALPWFEDDEKQLNAHKTWLKSLV